MEVEHSIEIIVNVDGIQVHKGLRWVRGTGAVAAHLASLDWAMVIGQALRQEAERFENALRQERAGDWIDAVPIEEGGS